MNSATRLRRIYEKLIAQSLNTPMVNIWTNVFGIDKKSPHYEDDVTACLMALRSEILLARKRLDAIGVPAGLTSPAFERLRDTAAPAQLNTSWHGLRPNIASPECSKVFEWAEWALGEDAEPDMPSDDMQDLRAELASLEAALKEAEVSPYLRDFIQRQVDTIRAALQVYGVQGAQPLQDALQRVVGAYTMERPRVEAEHAVAPEAAQSLFARTSSVIKKTAEVCDNLGKVGKFGEQAWTLAGTVGPLVLQYMPKFGG